jgi:diguanylate cyclase (GGDEF)-like protein
MPDRSTTVQLPLEVRRKIVDNLFSKPIFPLLSAGVCSLSAAVAAFETADMIYLAFSAYFLALAVYRFRSSKAYMRTRSETDSQDMIDKWERNYIYGASGVALGVGLLATLSMVQHLYTISPGIAMSLVGGTMMTVVGRTFGSIKSAKAMTIACCVPVIVGLLASSYIRGDFLIALVALPIGIMTLSGLNMSKYLNGLLLDALRSGRQSDIASQKFNVAISSMSNGLIMVDGDEKMIVVNQQAEKMLEIRSTDKRPLSDAIRRNLRNADGVLQALALALSSNDHEDMTYETVDSRWLQFGVRDLDVFEKRFMDEEWGGRQSGAYVLTILDVSRRVAADREMEHLARYDGLTQLANRRYWEEATQKAVSMIEPEGLVCLVVLDVDRFKLINDTMGHHIGDEVIRGVADRIRSIGDPRMLAGRLGGDEFVVLFPGVTSEQEASKLSNRLFGAISCSYVIASHNIEVRCSGGVIVRKKEEFNLHSDLSRVDMALYKVKRNPNRAWMLFDRHLEDEYQTANRIKHDLRDAIDQGMLEVIYQPIYDAAGERIVSAEALCRWEHYDAGQIPPSEFIAMAEEIGVIGRLTEYVLQAACRDCMSWNSDVGVAVNISSLDLARDGIVDMISNVLATHEMPASRLCIEVTETVFVKDFEKTARTLMILRNMGVKTSLDDFGTGYSSLSYMHRLPLNRVKIDRSFVVPIVNDPQTQQLFRAVVGLAKGLGFEVVVEGVEDRDQLEFVVSVPGVDMIQGYIFSRGLTNAEIAKMVEIKRPGWKDGKVIRLVTEGAPLI